ncbi:MAG: HEAT repeat domain-containing protein [Candidatus Hydrogenedentes bacterium]|nr:HEAT repeat domain-containing protein [Candidatus Hydrogenedentota bacterium]
MMRMVIWGGAVALMAWAAAAYADTIHLKNGIRFDGVVTPVPDQEGMYRVKAGRRNLIYRADEIERIEKNDKTGHLDRDALRARWEATNKALTEETGLTAEQRRLVRGLIFELKSESDARRRAIREQLAALQAEFDAFGYIVFMYPELSSLLAPAVLETLFAIDPPRSLETIMAGAESAYFGVRAMAIDLLGRAAPPGAVPLVARGLADHMPEVRIAAAYALASLGAREATPALIGQLSYLDQRVSNAAREALASVWGERLGEQRPATVDEWNAFWSAQSVSGATIALDKLKPLIAPEDEQTVSYDANH